MYDTGDSWHFFIRKGDIVMDKRDYKVNIRLNQEEYKILTLRSQQNNMTQSQYIRALINNAPLSSNDHRAEVWKLLCKIYNRAHEKRITDPEIQKEMNRICRTYLS